MHLPPTMRRFTSESNNCKPIGNVPYGVHACFAVPNATTVNAVVLCRSGFAVIKPTVANFLVLYLACFAVTVGYVPCLMDLDGLSNCGCCGHVLSSFTVHKCTVLHNQKQQLPTGWYCTMHMLPHQVQQQ